MNLFQAEHCAFEVPDDWEEVAPYGMIEPAQEGFRHTAVVNEEPLLSSIVDSREYAVSQRKLLAAYMSNLEVLKEGTLALPEHKDAYEMVFRYTAADGQRVVQRQVYFVHANRVFTLTLTALEETVTQWEKTFDNIVAGFRIVNEEQNGV